MRVALRGRFRGVEKPLVAHVAFTAAEENFGILLPLHTLVTAKVGNKKKTLEEKHTHEPLLIFPHGTLQRSQKLICAATERVHTHSQRQQTHHLHV